MTKLDFQFLEEFQRSFDEERVYQVGFDLLPYGVFDAHSFESSELEVRMIEKMNRTPGFAIE